MDFYASSTLSKTYDHLNWDFLLLVLNKMDFGRKWINWIKLCISTASYSLLVNVTPTGLLYGSRGLRQGDPFSSYLFVIGMEVLSHLIGRALEGGFFAWL